MASPTAFATSDTYDLGRNLFPLLADTVPEVLVGSTVRVRRPRNGSPGTYNHGLGTLKSRDWLGSGGTMVRIDGADTVVTPSALFRVLGEPVDPRLKLRDDLYINDRVCRAASSVIAPTGLGTIYATVVNDGVWQALVQWDDSRNVYPPYDVGDLGLATPLDVSSEDDEPIDDDSFTNDDDDDDDDDEDPIDECDECGEDMDDCECCSMCERRPARCDCCHTCENRSYNCECCSICGTPGGCECCYDCDNPPHRCTCNGNRKRASYHSIDRGLMTSCALNGTDQPVFGIEMEYVFDDEDGLDGFIEDVVARYTTNTPNADLIVEMDGSLPDDLGVELVAPPFTLEAIRSDDNLWRKVIEAAGDYDHRNYNNAGMHVNMDYKRNFGSSTRAMQAFILFFNRMYDLSAKIAGRNSPEYAQLVRNMSWEMAGQRLDGASKFYAVVAHGPRLEVRAMASTRDHDVFLSRVEYCDALSDFASTYALPYAGWPDRERFQDGGAQGYAADATLLTTQFISFVQQSGQWPTLSVALTAYATLHGIVVPTAADTATPPEPLPEPEPSLPRLESVHPLGSLASPAHTVAVSLARHADAHPELDVLAVLQDCGLNVYTFE